MFPDISASLPRGVNYENGPAKIPIQWSTAVLAPTQEISVSNTKRVVLIKNRPKISVDSISNAWKVEGS